MLAPTLRLMLRRRAVRGKEVPGRLGEREGIDDTPRPEGLLVWVHAASVGESVSVLPVIGALAQQAAVLVTTGTATSAAIMAERLPGLGESAGEGSGKVWVRHRFVPLDVPRWASRFLDHWRPDAVAFVESELWPNLLAGCRARAIPAVLVNGRMSERSFRGWKRTPAFARGVMAAFSTVHPQSDADAGRLLTLGATRMLAAGNLKLAAAPLPVDEAELARLRSVIGTRPVWLAASTHEGEEVAAVGVHVALAGRHPGLLTILAPRHPERGPALAEAFGARRRSLGQDPPSSGVWVADTLGELGLLYRLAAPVFLGGSLVSLGGHNPAEPARLGCTLAMGPNVQNCAEAVERLRRVDVLTIVPDAAGLADWLDGTLRAGAGHGTAGPEALAGEEDLVERVAGEILRLARSRSRC